MAMATGTYMVEGELLEVCSCNTLCPCWVGEDPDPGTCDAIVAWQVEKGEIKGVDVSGLTVGLVGHIPGNILAGNWRVAIFLDEKGTQEQRDALLEVFSGKMGGAIADLAQLIGEVVEVRVAPIKYNIEQGRGTVEIPGVLFAEMEPFRGPTGEPTKLMDSIFTTIPGSPAYLAKASLNRVTVPEHGMSWEFKGRNAVQGHFRFEA